MRKVCNIIPSTYSGGKLTCSCLEVSLEFAMGLGIGVQELAALEELQMSTHSILWHCRK
jgi:hypothetical protein